MSFIPWLIVLGGGAIVFYNYTRVPGPAATLNNETLTGSPINGPHVMPNTDQQSDGITPTPNPGLGAQDGSDAAPPQTSGFKPAQSQTYPGPSSTDHFGVISAPDDYEKILRSSHSWMTRHPASTPVTVASRSDPSSTGKNFLSALALHALGKSEQYSGAAVPTKLASIPVTKGGHGKPIQNPIKQAADISRAEKSEYLGTLNAGVMPAVGIHPDSPHASLNPFTQLKTGRVVKPTK